MHSNCPACSYNVLCKLVGVQGQHFAGHVRSFAVFNGYPFRSATHCMLHGLVWNAVGRLHDA